MSGAAGVAKRSFVELPVEVDVAALAAEVAALRASAWTSSYWGSPHGAVATSLLRGGVTGTQEDYLCDEVADQPVLASLPEIAALIGPAGPFGGCRYAFLFRMQPGGVARAHVDGAPVWRALHRVHVPLVSHPEAELVVEGRALHLRPGRAWTFDNQALHGFVNGPVVRTHLILDVPPGPAMDALLAAGAVWPGRPAPDAVARMEAGEAAPSYPGDAAIAALVAEARAAGWALPEVAAWLEAQGVPARTWGARWTAEALAAIGAGSGPGSG